MGWYTAIWSIKLIKNLKILSVNDLLDLLLVRQMTGGTTQFDMLYDAVLETIKIKSVDVSDLVIVATSAMQIVQQYPNLNGADKKRLVVDIMTKLVNDSGLVPAEQREAALIFLQHTLPNMIEVVINAYQHKIKLKKVGQGCICISPK
jgi:hypothetical protein